jgi:hypothetical protein
MAVAFELTSQGGDILESVVLDGAAVERFVGAGAAAEPTRIGWFRGEVDASVAGVVDALPEVWPVGQAPSPPAGGAWRAAGAGGVVGLWGEDQDGAEVRTALAAVLAECQEAATVPVAGATLRAEWLQLGDGEQPALTVAGEGAERIDLRIDTAAPGEPAAFVTPDAAVLGFTDAELWLEPGASAVAMLRDWPVEDDLVRLTGTMWTAVREPVPFTADIAVARTD